MRTQFHDLAMLEQKQLLLPGGRCKLKLNQIQQRQLLPLCQQYLALSIDQADYNEYAALTRIIDFEALASGYLLVTLQAEHIVKIISGIHINEGITQVSADVADHWSLQITKVTNKTIDTSLSALFNNIPTLAQLYPTPQWQNGNWQLARALELLPMSQTCKQHFLQPTSHQQACDYANQLFTDLYRSA